MMNCPECGASWGKLELAASACQGCGDLLLPDDLAKLRTNLGVEDASPPELEAPILESPPVALPDFEECPSCQAPLMADELNDWQSGSSCPYCSEKSPHHSVESEPDHQSDTTLSSNSESSQPKDGVGFILNSGNEMGKLVLFPTGIVGRQQFMQMIRDQSYDSALARVSKEHFRLDRSEDSVSVQITDMGSTNGTYLDGVRIVGTQPHELHHGSVLIISGLCLCLASRDESSFHITHELSGVRLEYPEEHAKTIHLGRLTEENNREPWARMAESVMDERADLDPDDLTYISRRHLFVHYSGSANKFAIWHQEGKEPWNIESDSETASISSSSTESTEYQAPIRMTLGRHTFVLEQHQVDKDG